MIDEAADALASEEMFVGICATALVLFIVVMLSHWPDVLIGMFGGVIFLLISYAVGWLILDYVNR